MLRYLVVDTGNWLPGRQVLISPASVAPDGAGRDAIRTELRREQVERAPGIEVDAPVSRQIEEAHARYYGYPYYWSGPYLWGAAAVPWGGTGAALAAPPAERAQEGSRERQEGYRQAEEAAEQSHLRSTAEVVGYRIHAADGEIGHVEDFLVDDQSWAIAGVVVDTRNWLPGKKVRVPPQAIEHVDWRNREVSVRVTREELKRAPELQ